MIEEATVDCCDELEQASGFYTMIEDHLAVPFATQVLGVEASVVGVEMDDNGSIKAVCERNGKRQLLSSFLALRSASVASLRVSA